MLCAADEPTAGRPEGLGREDNLTSPPGDVPILIVDDDPNFCTAVGRALASVPLRPWSVGTAAEALRFLARPDAPRPAFVVLDFNLPDRNAPAVLADPLFRTLPVLVLTQIAGPADERAVLEAGALAYHAKPSRAAALRELLLEFWRTHAGPHGDPDRR